VRHSNAILDFQRKRGDSSAAFVLPFLHDAVDVVDVGCGPGTITAALAKTAKSVTGIDIHAAAIRSARDMAVATGLENAKFVRGGMTALPFRDAQFDAVFFHAVLYHLDASVLASTLSEAGRVLKPGGFIATRDADVGGNLVYPETSGILLALDLFGRCRSKGGMTKPRPCRSGPGLRMRADVLSRARCPYGHRASARRD
jgi:ubiquinone/menaquinone biosynthesis C-methylase UbiE